MMMLSVNLLKESVFCEICECYIILDAEHRLCSGDDLVYNYMLFITCIIVF